MHNDTVFLSGPCNTSQQFNCFNASTTECVPLSQRCDGVFNCQEKEDEQVCCNESLFGCYVDVSDLFDPYGGTGNMQHYQCLEMRVKCDGMNDCTDGSDETDCKLHVIAVLLM